MLCQKVFMIALKSNVRDTQAIKQYVTGRSKWNKTNAPLYAVAISHQWYQKKHGESSTSQIHCIRYPYSGDHLYGKEITSGKWTNWGVTHGKIENGEMLVTIWENWEEPFPVRLGVLTTESERDILQDLSPGKAIIELDTLIMTLR